MRGSGSTVIADALLRGRGLLALTAGFLVLVVSSAVHASAVHALAALVFALCIFGLRELRKVDSVLLPMPWSAAVRVTDIASLVLLGAATFGPLFIIATGGHVHWDLPVLAGALMVWRRVLDALVADYRRVWKALAALGLIWLPLVVLHPSLTQVAEVVIPIAGVAAISTVGALRRTFRGVPRQYRRLKLDAD